MYRTTCSLALALVLAGCAADAPTAVGDAASSSAAVPAEHPDLAVLRAATARFHRHAAAIKAGYDVQFPEGCFESEAGAMGYHYLNAGYVGSLEVARPQLLMYEPLQNGRLRLVGVEYIVPGEPTDVPPVLFDQPFTYSEVFEVWVLHAWVWAHNPDGIFADWNPEVSCAHAAASAPARHH